MSSIVNTHWILRDVSVVVVVVVVRDYNSAGKCFWSFVLQSHIANVPSVL